MRLNCDTISAQTRDYDWSKGYAETWESWQAEQCPECGRVIVGSGEIECREFFRDDEEGKRKDCSGRVYFEGPMMNYYYPLPDDIDPEAAAEKLADLPLAVVKFTDDDAYGLALTGGGMDLSWEICAGFVALGYYPPRRFWRLPKMSGLKMTTARRRVLAAIASGITIERNWLRNDARDLADVRAYLRENSRKVEP